MHLCTYAPQAACRRAPEAKNKFKSFGLKSLHPQPQKQPLKGA